MTDTPVNYNDYPLPIAHEYREFLSAGIWEDRCLKAMDVLDVTLRYCLVIAISDYFEGSATDPTLTKWLWEQLRHPKTWELPQLLAELYAKLGQANQISYMPELYNFCYDEDGQRSVIMRKVDRIASGLSRPLSDQTYHSRVRSHEEERLKELYEQYTPDLIEALQELSFLQKYTLINIVSWQSNGNEYDWRVQELMGDKIPQTEEVVKWEGMGATPVDTGIALWDADTKRILFLLHPFALFQKVEPPAQEEAPAIEELLLYQRGESKAVLYYGLRETKERIPYQFETAEMFGAFTERTGTDPRQIWIDVSIAPLHPEGRKGWDELRGLGLRHSTKIVHDFKREKYLQQVYLTRENVEEQFNNFLTEEYLGFLVVGDSGTGKTNLLCHLVESRFQTDDIVLFFNCAELSEKDLDLGKLIIERLQGKFGGFGDFIDQLEELRGEREGKLLLVLDALNEHQAPQLVLRSLWEDVLTRIPKMEEKYQWFRVVLSCRTEAWKKLERYFEGGNEFYQTQDGVEVRLTQFNEAELPFVYENYKREYELKGSFRELSASTKRFVSDPLMLRFVAESYRGEMLPKDPETIEVLDRYYQEKLGGPFDSDRRGSKREIDKHDFEREITMYASEREIVGRLVELMYAAKSDELLERELRNDEEIGHFVQAADRVGTPYFRLVDKGILLRLKTEQKVYGAAAMFGGATEQTVRVRFTYDRFFEYLLALYVMPYTPTTERVRELAVEATVEQYSSLWGALKVRLIAYAEQDPNAFSANGILAELSKAETEGEWGDTVNTINYDYRKADAIVRHEVRGLMVDTLADYGTVYPKRIETFLSKTLLNLDSESAGMIAILSGHKLQMTSIFEVGYRHPRALIRQAAIQHTYYFWCRYRESGERFLTYLADQASTEVKRSAVFEAIRSISGEGIDMNRLPILSAFLSTTLLISGHLLSEPRAERQFAQNLMDFYNDFGFVKKGAVAIVQKWAGDAAIEGWRQGGVINLETLAAFTNLPLNDVRREEVKRYSPYMGTEQKPISEIEDKLIEWSEIGDGVISLVLVGILVNRSIYEPEYTLRVMRRMRKEGNAMSHYNVLRSMSSALQRNVSPCPGYLEFFNESVLDYWSNGQTMIEVDGKEYTAGHLVFPLVFEAHMRDRGKMNFVDRFMNIPWPDSSISRVITIIDHLGMSVFYAFRLTGASPYPLLDTLKQWFTVEQIVDSTADAEQLRNALGLSLARIWRRHPVEVEQYLEDYPDLLMSMFEAVRQESHHQLENLAGQGTMVSIVFLPTVLPGLVEVLNQICDEITDIETAVRMVGRYFVAPSTLEYILKSVSDT